MKRKLLPLSLVLVLLATHAPLALAQQSSSTRDWSAVQRLGTNTRLVVKQKSGKEVKGLMIEASDTTLRIDRDGRPVELARADVRHVHMIEGKASKGKWALIGAGIGAGAGAGIGFIKYSPVKDDYEIYPIMGTLIGTGAGAVGGLLFGMSRRNRVLVYSTD